MSASPPPSPQLADLIAKADHYQLLGRLTEAEAIYRDVLARDSLAPAALLGLSGIAIAVGRHETSDLLIHHAAGGSQSEAALWNELGARRFGVGDVGGAGYAFLRAVVLQPDNATYLYHLGVVRRTGGEANAAIRSLARAASAQPLHDFALSDLAVQWQTAGDRDKAEAVLRRLLALDPARSGGWHNFGLLMASRGRPAAEAGAYARATAIDAGFVPPHYNAGCLALSERRYLDATRHLQITLALAPIHAEAWNNLGCTRREQGLLDSAVRAFRCGHAADADNADLPSNLAMALTVLDGPASDRFAETWGRRYALSPRPPVHAGRTRLRVGYLSPDMRHHSCAFFLEPLFAAHDRGAVEVFAYADVATPDATTDRLRDLSDQWRDVAGQDDRAVIDRIVADDLDILVDLAGHTGRNRLRIFAARPAPVQLNWLGYNATTGLRQIDWKLADRWMLPMPGAEHFVEGLWTLDRVAHCWRPPADAPAMPVANPGRDRVVFGSFNALHKLSRETLATWARILLRVPASILRLKGGAGGDAATRARILDLMTAAGIPSDRIVIQDWAASTASHLSLYHDIDIALDPFPYNGTTTTCEALWMGVPVVALAGERMLSRVGLSLLSAVGLDDCIAADRKSYVETAVRLAGDGPRSAAGRAALRRQVAASDLRDEIGFARSVERAYVEMIERVSAA